MNTDTIIKTLEVTGRNDGQGTPGCGLLIAEGYTYRPHSGCDGERFRAVTWRALATYHGSVDESPAFTQRWQAEDWLDARIGLSGRIIAQPREDGPAPAEWLAAQA